MKIIPMLATAAAMLLAGTSAGAVAITGLYSTGVDSAGVATTGNGADLHWTLAGGTPYTGGVNGVFPIGPWLAEDAASRWLTPTPAATTSLDPVTDGLYVYNLSFSLAGFDPATATFAAQFAADNQVDSITLNGNLLGGSGGGFTSWTGFGASSGFVSGLNTLSVTLRNYASPSGNPAGLRIEILSSDVTAVGAGVPEPASWAMLIAGFGLVGAAMRRRAPLAA